MHLLLLSAFTAQAPPASLDARAILARMAEVYRACESYQDTGTVTTVFHLEDGEQTVTKPFTTSFVRPDRFRLECTTGPQKAYILWSDGEKVWTSWAARPVLRFHVRQPPTLSAALLEAAGPTDDVAFTIPALLGAVAPPTSVSALAEAVRVEDGAVRERRCCRVEGRLDDRALTLWIDPETFLLRRLDTERRFGRFTTETRIDYEPRIDVEIDAAALEPGLAPPRDPDALTGEVHLSLVEAGLEQLVHFLSATTGKVMNVDLAGLRNVKITLVGSEPVPKAEAVELILEALRLNDVEMIEDERMITLRHAGGR